MTSPGSKITLRFADSADELPSLEPLWNALQEHHVEITPSLGDVPSRELPDSWRKRREKYERWLEDPGTFIVIAEVSSGPVGYAFVTVGPGYASWQTDERMAELETLSVLAGYRGSGVGAALLESATERLAEMDVRDLVVASTSTNVDAHRFYERHGFTQHFVLHYRRS